MQLSNWWDSIFVSFFYRFRLDFSMAASWLRIHELESSDADFVCTVARIQSINTSQRMIILSDDEDNRTSSNLQVSLVNLRTPMNIQSPGQYVQVYGKVIRQGGRLIRIDAQLIRSLGIDFDIHEYVKGLMLTRNYMADTQNENGEVLVDNNGNPIRTFL